MLSALQLLGVTAPWVSSTAQPSTVQGVAQLGQGDVLASGRGNPLLGGSREPDQGTGAMAHAQKGASTVVPAMA